MDAYSRTSVAKKIQIKDNFSEI